MRTVAVLVICYTIGAIISFGALNATNQANCHTYFSNICDARLVRRDIGDQIIVAAIPVVGWGVVLVVTSLYADGITFSATPAMGRRE
jgi:hypothetical protein